jgi:hypothetical protein
MKIKKIILILAIIAVVATPQMSQAAFRSNAALLERVADLETAVTELQNQNIESSCTCPNVAILETRVTVLEKTVSFIIGQISQTLTQILKYITK